MRESRYEQAWEGSADLPYFAGFGGAIPLYPEEVRNPARGTVAVVVRAAPEKQRPTPWQQDAWRRLIASGPAVFDRVMGRVLAMYRAQRATRVHWWNAIYGPDDPMLAEVLPDVATTDALRPLVRPTQFRINADGSDARGPSVGILFDAAWDHGDAFGVLLRDGDVIEVGPKHLANESPRPAVFVEHPVFGLMRRDPYEWAGVTRCEPFRSFYEIAEDRASFLERYRGTNVRCYVPPWEFIDGRFGLDVEVDGPAGEPSTEMAQAYRSFMADPGHSAARVLGAIFDYYQGVAAAYREAFDDQATAELLAPRIDSVEGLRPLMHLQGVKVYTSPASGAIALGLGFHCSWEQEHGLGVRWRAGDVEEVGCGEVSFS
jgi:hypothetical protein